MILLNMMFDHFEDNRFTLRDHYIEMNLSHDGHILAITLTLHHDKELESFDPQMLETINLDAIDALALQPTHNPDPWRFTVAARIWSVSDMQEVSSALKSQMPLMQSVGRLIIKWNPQWEDKIENFEVWDDKTASKQDNRVGQ